MKRVSNVIFAGEKPDVNFVAKIWPVKLSRPDLGNKCRTVMSAEGASTDIGLSDIDGSIGQITSAG